MAWSSKLSRQIKLAGDCGTLVTLKDAAEFIQKEFRAITRSEALNGTIEDLMRAAESGKLADRRAATNQLEIFLSAQRVLAGQSTEDIQARFRRMVAHESGERPKQAAAKTAKPAVRRSR